LVPCLLRVLLSTRARAPYLSQRLMRRKNSVTLAFVGRSEPSGALPLPTCVTPPQQE
jgi:hypothetical protein